MSNCKFCGKKLPKSLGNREKEYCDNTCRSNYWYANNVKGKDKPKKQAVKKKSTKKATVSKKVKPKKKVVKKKSDDVAKKKPSVGVRIEVKLPNKHYSNAALVLPGGESIPLSPPVRREGESAIDFAARKNAWKKQNLK